MKAHYYDYDYKQRGCKAHTYEPITDTTIKYVDVKQAVISMFNSDIIPNCNHGPE